jgi:hypothetical protein
MSYWHNLATVNTVIFNMVVISFGTNRYFSLNGIRIIKRFKTPAIALLLVGSKLISSCAAVPEVERSFNSLPKEEDEIKLVVQTTKCEHDKQDWLSSQSASCQFIDSQTGQSIVIDFPVVEEGNGALLNLDEASTGNQCSFETSQLNAPGDGLYHVNPNNWIAAFCPKSMFEQNQSFYPFEGGLVLEMGRRESQSFIL